jgi:hypothetical protein
MAIKRQMRTQSSNKSGEKLSLYPLPWTAVSPKRVARELRALMRQMNRESLRSGASSERYNKEFGAYRALKWILGIGAVSPLEYINNPVRSYEREQRDYRARERRTEKTGRK